MSRKNWNYKTTRNKESNNFLHGFKNEGDKKYNDNIIKKYFVDEELISKWEKEFYQSIKKQEYNITDNQYKIIHSIHKKYTDNPLYNKKKK